MYILFCLQVDEPVTGGAYKRWGLSYNRDFTEPAYHKMPIICPGLIFVGRLFWWAYFTRGLFSEGLIIGRSFALRNENKNSFKH